MSRNSSSSSSGGLGLSSVLTIVFVVLKLVGVIDWSWVWVLSPTWISFLIGMIALLILVLVYKEEIRLFKKSKRSDKLKW